MDKYLLSIIIPTKNREEYCIKTIDHILKTIDHRDDIQIVIQDNSSSQLIEQHINIINNSQIKYLQNKEIISFVDNFHIAVDNADGSYIMMIGDDDGILPYLIDVLNIAHKRQIDAIIPDLGAVYFWPSNKDIIKNSREGMLIHSKRPISVKRVNTKIGLQKISIQRWSRLSK